MPARPLRRVVAALVCSACLLTPQAVASSPASRPADGDRSSGPPTWSATGVFSTNGIRWSDVPRKHWARKAIDYVGATNDWMLDRRADEEGRYAFEPDRLESRKLWARALFRAFVTPVEPDPALEFSDLPADDRFYRFAANAVAAGWMEASPEGTFRPEDPVTTHEVHLALVTALGMQDLAAGAQALHLQNGTPIDVPRGFGTLLIGMRLGLRYNHGDESLDVAPDTPLPRAEVAWSLYRAATAPSWVRDSLEPYATMELPNLTKKLQQVVAFGVQYVGQPHVWGGEWHQASPSGYCCGYQPAGGFDCSGLTWWVMKAADAGWDNTPPRPYTGWALPQRTSAQMASVGRVRWKWIEPGDLLFYDGNDDGTVDHVDTYIGNGWAIDSGGSNAGVTITYVFDNWYEDHFVYARHIAG
ncbi:MAG: NlpC/P60 family protein [Actinobacteria bacterium]|nr:NlpC/P60 family protein [Actinomycetota bacterium]